MQEDLENEIERKKKEIEDFLRIVKFTGLSQKEIEKRLDYLLDDLSRLMKNRKKCFTYFYIYIRHGKDNK